LTIDLPATTDRICYCATSEGAIKKLINIVITSKVFPFFFTEIIVEAKLKFQLDKCYLKVWIGFLRIAHFIS